MAEPLLIKLGKSLKNGAKALYKWLGITSGSLMDIPGNHIRVGRVFLERGNAEEALRRAKLAVWMRKNSPEPYALMVEAHAALGQKAEAEQAYNKAGQLQYSNMQQLRDTIAEVGKEKPAADEEQ